MNKIDSYLIHGVLLFFIMLFLTYVLCAFVMYDLDSRQWGVTTRLVFAIIIVVEFCCVFYAVTSLMDEAINEKNKRL